MSRSPLVSGAAFDVRGLDALKREVKTNSQDGLKAAARQMESMFVQMMLKSMRDASFKGGLLQSQASDMYTSMYDQQVSQNIASQGKLGFADLMMKQLGGEVTPSPSTSGVTSAPYQLNPALLKPQHSVPSQVNTPVISSPVSRVGESTGKSADFISRLLEPAIAVAKKSGIPHQLIIAQAALESGWGNKEIPCQDGKPSHNLFGIKATDDWKGESTEITTTEYINGVMKKVKAAFRVYPSYTAALSDYASLLTNNPRYKHVTKSGTPEKAAHALQFGGYATDPDYAKKLINIIQKVKGNVSEGIKAYKTDLSSIF